MFNTLLVFNEDPANATLAFIITGMKFWRTVTVRKKERIRLSFLGGKKSLLFYIGSPFVIR